jgi:hypothetical protein
MNRRLVHPLWMHLGAIAAFIVFLIVLFTGSIPAEAPVHFGGSGIPDQFGSPWESIGITIGLSLLFIAVSILLDELWARQEKSKKFNWFTPFDDITVGVLVGVQIGYLDFLRSGNELFSFPWVYVVVVGGGAILLSVVLEYFRPYRRYSAVVGTEEAGALKEQISQAIKNNSAFVYWYYQNPAYVNVLSIGMPVVFVVTGCLTLFSQLWVSIVLFVVGLPAILFYGGQRTMINRRELTVRWGLLGLKVLRLQVNEISQAVQHEFAPLRDFGGYGIRFNREMKAYFMRGSVGVRITMSNGKKYLIGSDRPQQLAAVLETMVSS